MATDANRARGQYGEDRAARWYVEHGYEVLERNWRGSAGELDLIVRRVNEVVFVEVKARASMAFGSPLEAINAAKQRRIRALAAEWLRTGSVNGARLRFDAVAVLGVDVHVVEGAF